jgi:hypothetical protein
MRKIKDRKRLEAANPVAKMPPLAQKAEDAGTIQFWNPGNSGHQFSAIALLPEYVQTKTSVSQPNDPCEQEADRVAEQVVRQPESNAAAGEKQPAQLRQASSHQIAPQPGGIPLNLADRKVMEPRFGFDFSQVRIHTDSHSAEAAASLHARAFTSGTDIVFADGEYAPGTAEGTQLLSHELVHVVQQSESQQPGVDRMIQRSVVGGLIDLARSDESLIPEADKGDLDAIKGISDYGKLTDSQRSNYIHKILEQGEASLGWRDKRALMNIWSAFPLPRGAALRNPADWAASVKANGDLVTIPTFASLPMLFKIDIEHLAGRILDSNQQEVEHQFDRLGADKDGNPRPDLTPKEAERIKGQEKAAAQVLAIQDYQRTLNNALVGYIPPPPDTANPGSVKYPYTFGQYLQSNRTPPKWPADPSAPPVEKLEGAWKLSTTTLKSIFTMYPALYTLSLAPAPVTGGAWAGSAEPPSALNLMANATSPQQGQRLLLDSLKRVKKNIEDAHPKLTGTDLAYQLTHVHKRLTEGRDKGSNDWSGPVEKPIAERTVQNFNEDQAAATLGLSSAAALGFIIAEFATGGLATFAMATAIAASGIAAADTIEKAFLLSGADDVAASPDEQLLEHGKSGEAAWEAEIAGILLIVDAVVAAGSVIGLLSGGASSLKNLDQLSKAEAAAAIRQSVDSIGVAGTMRAAGKSLEELAVLAEADAELAKALRLSPVGRIGAEIGLAFRPAIIAAAGVAKELEAAWHAIGTVEGRIAKLEQRLNEGMARIGAPRIQIVPQPGKPATGMFFSPHQYEIAIPLEFFQDGRSAEQIIELTALGFHEARHAEQWFLVARRMKAMGASEAEIAARTGLNPRIVSQATPLVGATPETAAIDRWLQSIGTKQGQQHRTSVYEFLDKSKEDFAAAQKALKDAEATKDAAKIRTARDEYEDARNVLIAAENDYRNLAEEIDAYGVSNAIMQSAAGGTGAAGAAGAAGADIKFWLAAGGGAAVGAGGAGAAAYAASQDKK